MDKESKIRLARLIDSVIAGRIRAADAIEEMSGWSNGEDFDRAANDAYHQLIHFRDDEDIRARDAIYADEQVKGLERTVQRLRSSAE